MEHSRVTPVKPEVENACTFRVEIMKRFAALIVTIVAMAFAFAPVASAKDANPVFGSAKVQTLSKADNQKVVGKGYYANLYGYYGYLYSYYATSYGYYARFQAPANSSSEYTNYYYAYLYARTASNYYYYAYYYSYYGS